jgi:PAS domain S-box-containing protein
VFDLRTFSLEEMYRCSAELRSLGEASKDIDDAAHGVIDYLYEALRKSDTRERECRLIRLFRSVPFWSLSEQDASACRAAYADADVSTSCLSLRATRGLEADWNDPACSREHRVIALPPEPPYRTPMLKALVEQLGMPVTGSAMAALGADRPPRLFDVFHVVEAHGSSHVPDQERFVEPYKVQSVLGFGGVVPPAQIFVVLLFSCVTIPASTAELFRTLAPSVGLALVRPRDRDRSLEDRVRAYEQIVHQHERVAVARDQELRQAANELRRSLAERQRLEALIQNSGDFVGMADPEERWTYLNPAGRRMVGLGPDLDVTKARVGDYFAPEVRETVESVASRTVLAGGCWVGESLLRNWQTNATIPVSVHYFAVREDGNQRLMGFGVVMRDMSCRQQAEQERERLLASAEQARAEAQAANRSKDEFLAVLGHEMRNPLSPIMTALDLMRLRGAGSRELDVIERQASHLRRLVDDLLDVANITRGRVMISRKPVETQLVVERALEMVEPLFDQRRQSVTVDVPRSGLAVFADAGRLAQVVSNLLNNASKYSPVGSSITVSAKRADSVVRLSVRDRGLGIAREMLDVIFGSFVQRPPPGSPTTGLGLGLSIVRSLVQLHGGTVHACSEGPGQGSEFIVELPALAEAVETSTTGGEAPAPQVLGPKTRVLIVDDNEDAATLLGDTLTELGYEVAVANDGPSALRVAPELKPQVGLLDIGLPVMDGYELARRLRALPEVPADMRLVAITGYGQDADRCRSREAGFAAHLVKPIALDALTAALRASS